MIPELLFALIGMAAATLSGERHQQHRKVHAARFQITMQSHLQS
jgi:hypothetical protein